MRDDIRGDRRFRLSFLPAPSVFGLQERSRPKAYALFFCKLGELLQAAAADAACGKVDDTGERPIVVGVGGEAQIGQRVLDFLAFEEAQSPVDAVRHSGSEQRMLQ